MFKNLILSFAFITVGLSCLKSQSQDEATQIAQSAPKSNYTTEWLDKVDELSEGDIALLKKEKQGSDDKFQEKIDITIKAFNQLRQYGEEKGSNIKKEVFKLATTAMPSNDINQNEWNKRASALGDSWMPYLPEMQINEGSGFKWGISRMLAHGIAELGWKDDIRQSAIKQLRIHLKSEDKYVALGALVALNDANISDLNDEVLPLLLWNDPLIGQAAVNLLGKTGNTETASQMKRVLLEFERDEASNSQKLEASEIIKATIKNLEKSQK